MTQRVTRTASTMDNTKSNTDQLPIHSIAVKLTPFCSKEAILWFRQAEVQFRLRRVTGPRTKADNVLQAISEEIFLRIASWLDNQEQDVDYEELKSYLLQEFTLSVSGRTQRLLSLSQLSLEDTTAHAA